MKTVVYRFSLDLQKTGAQKYLQGTVAGEVAARKLVISLTQNGEAFPLPDDGTYVVYMNAAGISHPCSIEGGNIVYEFQQSDFSEPGVKLYQAQILLASMAHEEQALFSPSFQIEVSATDAYFIADSKEYTALQNALAQAQVAYNASIADIGVDDNDGEIYIEFKDGRIEYHRALMPVISQEHERQEQEASRERGFREMGQRFQTWDDAEWERTAAESKRVTAEQTRVMDEVARTANEGRRMANENARIEAETAREETFASYLEDINVAINDANQAASRVDDVLDHDFPTADEQATWARETAKTVSVTKNELDTLKGMSGMSLANRFIEIRSAFENVGSAINSLELSTTEKAEALSARINENAHDINVLRQNIPTAQEKESWNSASSEIGNVKQAIIYLQNDMSTLSSQMTAQGNKIVDLESRVTYLEEHGGGGGGGTGKNEIIISETEPSIDEDWELYINPNDAFNAVVVGGESGTTDYNALTNKPSINGVVLEGNKTAEELGITGTAIFVEFNTFPTDAQLETLCGGVRGDYYFRTCGFYNKKDLGACSYLMTTEYMSNCIKKTINGIQFYIIPLLSPNYDKVQIFLPYYGIRRGAEYAEANSNIIENVIANKAFGGTYLLPCGEFYFARGINLGSTQMSLKGNSIAFATDVNVKGHTRLIFPTLGENEYAISVSNSGSVSDLSVWGVDTNYNVTLDRTKTYTDVDNIVSETSVAKTTGIKINGASTVHNVMIRFFYNGITSVASNTTITDITFRNCHYGIVASNDVKIKGIYGWNVMTLLRITGSLVSAIQVRGDSVGEHLVEIYSGNGIYLCDLDADYCVKSPVHIGGSYNKIQSLIINGVHGRGCTKHAYHATNDNEPTFANVTNSTVDEYGVISVAPKSTVTAKVDINTFGGSNPYDSSSNYLTPKLGVVAGSETNITFDVSVVGKDEITKDFLTKYFGSFSTNSGENTVIKVSNSKHTARIIKSASRYTYEKISTEELV